MSVLFRFVEVLNQFVWDLWFLIRRDASQYGEERLIRTHFTKVTPGIYLEIGAHQPIKCSNTWFLYRRGWRGLCIDPQSKFAINWKFLRPNDVFLPIAVSAEEKSTATLFDFERRVNLVSTLDPEFASSWSDKGYKFRTKVVPALSPEQVVKRFIATFGREPDFVLIDVEGLDYVILTQLLKYLAKTKWVLFEDHKCIPLDSIAPGFVEVGRSGPSVLISRH